MTERGFWCVVPAAGSGRRLGGDLPKQHRCILGKTLLAWTLERLAQHPRIAGLMVVISANDSHGPGVQPCAGKPLLTAQGGRERADSVLAGLRALPAEVGDQDFVLVHDAARPLVRHSDIDNLIEKAMQTGGALLAAPLRDTLKLADLDGRVKSTEPRDSRWRAMTPQMFRRGELCSALASASESGVAVTDEAMAMERAGFRPSLVEGSEDNLKVTTAADLEIVEFLLGRAGH